MSRLFLICLALSCFAFACCSATWLSEALQCQQYLSRDVTFDLVNVAQTHNSYNSRASGYKLAPNQHYTITEQLDLGVRALELDLHRISALNPPTRVCHGSQDTYDSCKSSNFVSCGVVGIVDYGASTGCFSDAQTWPDFLGEIAAWTSTHPNDFVTIWLESTGTIPASEINNAITAAFPTGVFTPGDLTSFGSYPTHEDLIAGNYRVFFAQKTETWNGVYVHDIDEWPGYPAKKIKYFQSSTCTSSNAGPTHPDPVQFGVFYGDESALLGIIDGPSDVGIVDETNAPQLFDCGYSAAFDLVSTRKLKSTVWSWDRSRPTTNTSLNCAAIGPNNVWYDENCNTALPFACQSDTDSNDWVISAQTGAWSASAGKCPSGYSFSVPSVSIQQYNLKIAKQTATTPTVWLKLNDQTTEGKWSRTVGSETGNLYCVSSGAIDTPDVDFTSTAASSESDGVQLHYSALILAISLFVVCLF